MKILYAASNNLNAKITLARFLKAMEGSKHQIKVSAFKKSSPKNVNIDWTLDALLNMYRPEMISLNNDNISIYLEQIKSYAPDLIISDLEYFTSSIAHELNIATWQCSSSLINYALSKNDKYNAGVFKYHAHTLNRDFSHSQRMINIINNSQYNFVYSHYGDMTNPPALTPNFYWIRPYHKVTKQSVPCQHSVVATVGTSDKKLVNYLAKYQDCVLFMNNPSESHSNPQIKNIESESEYYCNLQNSDYYVCQGQTNFLADAFYNGKYSIIFPDYKDTESIINSQLAQKMKVGHIMTYDDELPELSNFEFTYSDSIKYLHEYIEAL